jgi:hypothetical protein
VEALAGFMAEEASTAALAAVTVVVAALAEDMVVGAVTAGAGIGKS